MSNLPIIQNINNNLLFGYKVMPLKDGSTNNTSSFGIDRRLYQKTNDSV